MENICPIFQTSTGPKTYVQYYKEKYQLEVRDKRQPLLVSKPSQRDINRGWDHDGLLVPEVCNMTGLSDEQRADFTLMKVKYRLWFNHLLKLRRVHYYLIYFIKV